MDTREYATVPAGIRLGVTRGITYGLLDDPEPIVPAVRGLGARLVRVFLYWAQVEPEPGRYMWDAVDALLDQLDGDTELWLTVCASSWWGTRRATDFLPPSPATDPAPYEGFVRALAARCAGRVAYWQAENEPCYPFFWDGTVDEYAAHLTAFHRAVKDADPGATVVLGGMPPGAAVGDGDEEEAFFATLLPLVRDAFDALDLHLYGDPYQIPAMIGRARELMRAAGCERPVLVGEYNGPLVFQWPEAVGELVGVLRSGAMAPEAIASTAAQAREPDTAPTPARDAMADLYARRAELPGPLRMFLDDEPELAARRDRINVREIVMRNVLALSAGVTRTSCWSLAPEYAGQRGDPYEFLYLMFGRFLLMEYAEGRIARRLPAADALALLVSQLSTVESVVTWEIPDRTDVYAFRIARAGRGPLVVAWARRDGYTGEDEPPSYVSLPWAYRGVGALDAFGAPVLATLDDGKVHLDLTDTPVYLSPG